MPQYKATYLNDEPLRHRVELIFPQWHSHYFYNAKDREEAINLARQERRNRQDDFTHVFLKEIIEEPHEEHAVSILSRFEPPVEYVGYDGRSQDQSH